MKDKHLTMIAWGFTLTGLAILASTLRIASEARRTEATSGANASALMSIVHRISPNLEEMKKEVEEEEDDIAETEAIKPEPIVLPESAPGKEASLKKVESPF